MNKAVEKFGEIVGDNVGVSPSRALFLLRAGYRANLFKQKAFPDKRLLPHQRYVAVMSSKAILGPLSQPKRSAVVNLFFPCQILHAMDIIPQFTEGLACYLNGAASEQDFIEYAENSGIPKTYCSYHKVLLGASLSDVMPKPRFVASTSLACDANNSTFRTIAEHYKVPYYMVDVPSILNDETIEYVAGELREFTSMVEYIMGEKMDEERLRICIHRTNNSIKLYKKHLEFLSGKYLSGDVTSEMYKIFPTHILLGTEEAERYFELLLEDTRLARQSNGEKRILWVHTIPFWQESIRNVFNFSEYYQLLPCDINFDSLEELDESHPYESIARRLLLNIVNGRGENRAKKIIEMAKKLNAHGVVYFCHWGCKHTLGNAQMVSELLSKEGIPVLILDGDGCDRKNINDGQMITKLQAFLEMLEVTV